MERRPTLHLLAGPNGAGKSTLYELRIRPMTDAPFVNADDIRRAAVHRSEALDAYEAARRAAAAREAYIAERRSFVTETVFSHPSKLALIAHAQQAGFRVVLYHVHAASPNVCVARVRWRAHEGGHDVREDKIRARFDRNQAYIRQAALEADKTLVYDSSKAHAPARWLLTFKHGQLYETSDDLPAWAQMLYDIT